MKNLFLKHSIEMLLRIAKYKRKKKVQTIKIH